MWPVLGALGGSLLTGMFNQSSANKQMQFQKDMRSDSYQTAVKDMQKAGINPMLAYQQGGAPVPSGASASMPDLGSSVTSGVHSAVAAKTVNPQIENMKADTALKGESAKAAAASSVAALAQANLANQNSATAAALRPYQVETANYGAGLTGANMLVAKTAAERAGIDLEQLLTPLGRGMAAAGFYTREAGSSISSALGSVTEGARRGALKFNSIYD